MELSLRFHLKCWVKRELCESSLWNVGRLTLLPPSIIHRKENWDPTRWDENHAAFTPELGTWCSRSEMLCIRIHGVCSLLLLLLPPPWSWRNGQPPATCRSRVFFSSCDLEIALRRRHRRLHLLVWCFPNSVADWKSLSSIATHSLGSHT
jgi:hypothetical protein